MSSTEDGPTDLSSELTDLDILQGRRCTSGVFILEHEKLGAIAVKRLRETESMMMQRQASVVHGFGALRGSNSYRSGLVEKPRSGRIAVTFIFFRSLASLKVRCRSASSAPISKTARWTLSSRGTPLKTDCVWYVE